MYVFNVAIQAIISLAAPIAVGFGAAWLLVEKLTVGEWIYIPLIIIGVMSGLVSMVRFVISSMAGIERLEKEQEDAARERKRKKKEGDAYENGKE